MHYRDDFLQVYNKSVSVTSLSNMSLRGTRYTIHVGVGGGCFPYKFVNKHFVTLCCIWLCTVMICEYVVSHCI